MNWIDLYLGSDAISSSSAFFWQMKLATVGVGAIQIDLPPSGAL